MRNLNITDKNIKLLNLFTVCLGMIFSIPVIIPYYHDEIGLSFEDFLLGEAFFAATLVILEVPSGWISDIWKRKHVLALSCVFWILGFSLLLFASNLVMAILSQIILGIASSLFSGTNSAILYDSLLLENCESEFSRHEGKRNAINLYSAAISGIAGGFIYEVNPQLVMLGSVIMAVPALVFALMMVEPPRHKSATLHNPVKDMAITMKYALHGHAEIALIIIMSALLFSATKVIMFAQQPYYMVLEIPESMFGILTSVGLILGGISSHLAHKLDGRISNVKILFLLTITAIFISIAASLSYSWYGVILLMFGGTCLFGLGRPRVSEAINKRVDSSRRATILSTQSLLVQIFFIPLSFLINIVNSDKSDVVTTLHIAAIWLILGGIILTFQVIKKR